MTAAVVFQRRVRTLLIAAALGLASVGATPVLPGAVAHAEDAVPGRVDVEVIIVRASHSDPRIDDQLKPLLPALRNFPYKGFRFGGKHTVRLEDGKHQSVAVPGGREVRLTLVSHDASAAKVRVEMFHGSEKTTDTTFTVKRDRTFFLGAKGEGDEALVIPVTVKY